MRDVFRTMAVGAVDDILGTVGLIRKQALGRMGPGVMWFAAGAVCGGLAALLLTPVTGDELLTKIEGQVQRARKRLRIQHRGGDGELIERARSVREEGIGAA